MKNNPLVMIAIFFALASAAGVILETVLLEADAQAGQFSNNTKTPYSFGQLNVTGSIPLGPTISQSIRSQIHTSLSQAASIAQEAVRQNSSVSGANLRAVNGFLVYNVNVVGDNATHYRVLVDAGNGKVLSTQSLGAASMMDRGMKGGECHGEGSFQHGYYSHSGSFGANRPIFT